jgi:hypothetical protein
LNKSNGGVGDGRLHIGQVSPAHMTRHTHARTRSHAVLTAHNAQIKELKSMEKVGGSCVAACMVVGHRLFVANVGDCEAVLARWQPALEQYQGSSLRKPQSHAYTPRARLTTTLWHAQGWC